MSDPNYWKDRYQQTWGPAKMRQDVVASLIDQIGLKTEPVGLGADSTDYIAGSAASRGFERGGADLHILGTSIYLEVTGPLVQSVGRAEPLWLRPDKIQNARSHLAEHETWVIHCLADNRVMRVVELDSSFFQRLDIGAFRVIERFIRGTRERYVEIPASDVCVQPWEALIKRLQRIASS